MVAIPDITDRESLEAWLKYQPREGSDWIASRAAARVLPVWWDAVLTKSWAHERDLTALPVLRCLMISSVAVFQPIEYIRNAAFSANAARAAAVAAAARAAADARAAAAAAFSAAFSANARAAAAAADAANAFSAEGRAAVWHAIRTDAAQVADGTFPDALPLWPDGAGPLAKEWANIKAQLAKSSDLPDWQFWIDWYDAQLSGRTMLSDPDRTWDMLEQIALIDPKIWDAGPDTVNPEIRKIWEGCLVDDVIAQNPLALRIARNEKTGKLESFPTEARDLEDIVKSIRQALREFTARCKRTKGVSDIGQYMLNAFDAPIKDLRRDAKKYREDPRQLFRVLEETRRELRLIAETEGFTRDSSVDRLLGNLEQQGEDICVSSPEVLEEVKQRLSVKVQLFKTEQITSAMRMTCGMIADSDGLLRSAAAQALLVIIDDARSEAEKKAAWTFLLGALPRGAREMRADDEDGSKASDDPSVLETVSDYADKASKIGRGIDALKKAASEGGPWAAEVYTEIASGNLWGSTGSG